VSAVQSVGTAWGSTLSVLDGAFFDELESVGLQFRLVNNGENCPVSGNPSIEGSGFDGEFIDPLQKWSLSNVNDPKFAGVAAMFGMEYVFTARNAMLRVGQNGGAPQWQLGGVFLASTELAGVQDESGAVEIVAKAAGITLGCKAAKGVGLIYGAAEGVASNGEGSLELSSCEVVGSKTCKVGSPITLTAKTTLVALAENEYGEELAAKEGGTLATITLENASEKATCAKKGMYKLSGDTMGVVATASETLEFTSPAKKGSALKLGESEAVLISKISNKEDASISAG
jgi:hypothetical protein